jgi:hypothetical protein
MKARLHCCAAEGCQLQVPLRLLMCVDHWRMVPVAVRREILGAWKRRRSADVSEQIDAVADYRGAVARAVAAVKEKQERKAQERAGPSGSLFNE